MGLPEEISHLESLSRSNKSYKCAMKIEATGYVTHYQYHKELCTKLLTLILLNEI